MNSRGRFVIAIILIVFGAGFLLDQLQIPALLGVESFTSMAWPLILIVLGLWLLSRRNGIGGWILLALGIIFEISATTQIDAISVLWPLLLIVLGVSLLYRRTAGVPEKNNSWEHVATEAADTIDETAVFSGIRRVVQSSHFQGGSVTAIFGGAEIDLSGVTVAKEGATVTVNAIFGGATIRVPKHCRVVSNGTPVLGGWDNKYSTDTVLDAPTLTITGSAVFGGVDVKGA